MALEPFYEPYLFSFQEELDEIKAVWNSHRIRPTKNPNVPSGIPDMMFTVPQLWFSEDLIVPHNDLDDCKQACKFLSSVPCDEDIFDLCSIVMSESGLSFPTNKSQAQEFYLTLREGLRPLVYNWAATEVVFKDPGSLICTSLLLYLLCTKKKKKFFLYLYFILIKACRYNI